MALNITTKNLIHDIIDTWNEQHYEEFLYEGNMSDDSVCVYRDDNMELNLESVENGLSATFYNLTTNTVDDYAEFSYGGISTIQEWVDEMVDYLMMRFDVLV